MKIQAIDLMLSDGSIFCIEKDNILEYDYVMHYEPISEANDSNTVSVLPILDNFLLVVDDYNNIFNIDTLEEFDPNRKDISQIIFYYDNNDMDMVYVNLSTQNFNERQINTLDKDRLYITIDENL